MMEHQEIKAMLERFEDAAKTLQASLLDRNVAGIWKAIDEQEDAASRLRAVVGANKERIEEASLRDPSIRRMIERSQSVLRANRAMAARFLDVIDQTLSQLGGRSGSSRGYGGCASRSTPLLVRQQG